MTLIGCGCNSSHFSDSHLHKEFFSPQQDASCGKQNSMYTNLETKTKFQFALFHYLLEQL